VLQPSPFLDGNEHGGFDTSACYDLWAFLESGFEELAKPSFSILQLPLSHPEAQYD
jgi:hypothetical protein